MKSPGLHVPFSLTLTGRLADPLRFYLRPLHQRLKLFLGVETEDPDSLVNSRLLVWAIDLCMLGDQNSLAIKLFLGP